MERNGKGIATAFARPSILGYHQPGSQGSRVPCVQSTEYKCLAGFPHPASTSAAQPLPSLRLREEFRLQASKSQANSSSAPHFWQKTPYPHSYPNGNFLISHQPSWARSYLCQMSVPNISAGTEFQLQWGTVNTDGQEQLINATAS